MTRRWHCAARRGALDAGLRARAAPETAPRHCGALMALGRFSSRYLAHVIVGALRRHSLPASLILSHRCVPRRGHGGARLDLSGHPAFIRRTKRAAHVLSGDHKDGRANRSMLDSDLELMGVSRGTSA